MIKAHEYMPDHAGMGQHVFGRLTRHEQEAIFR